MYHAVKAYLYFIFRTTGYPLKYQTGIPGFQNIRYSKYYVRYPTASLYVLQIEMKIADGTRLWTILFRACEHKYLENNSSQTFEQT